MERVIDPANHYHECKQCGSDLGICSCLNPILFAYRCNTCAEDPEPEREE